MNQTNCSKGEGDERTLCAKINARFCPVCCGLEVETLYTQNFVLPEHVPLPDKYDIVCCKSCGFVYANTVANQDIYDEYYAVFSKYEDPEISSGGLVNDWDKQKFEPIAQSLSVIIKKDSAILDIGCANGGLLVTFKQMGYSNLTGIDPSKTCASYVKDTYKIRVFEGGVFNLNNLLGEETYDLIILSHVLEHIYDIQSVIDMIITRLNIGGYFYIETPDSQNYCNYPVVPFYYFDCEHINHFDLCSLRNLAESNGLSYVSSINRVFPASSTTMYPAVGVVFQNNGQNAGSYHIINNDKSKLSVLSHINDSKRLQKSFWDFSGSVTNAEKVTIWGAGSYALRLLGEGQFDEVDIVAFIDNDKKKHSSQLAGKVVHGPEYLKSNNLTVIICSALYDEEILKQIGDMGIVRKVIIPFKGEFHVGSDVQ